VCTPQGGDMSKVTKKSRDPVVQMSSKDTTPEGVELITKQVLIEIEIKVPHSGAHGTFIKGDRTVLDAGIAKELIRCGYAVECSRATGFEVATTKQTTERR